MGFAIEETLLDSYKKWLVSSDNPDYTGREKYYNYDYYLRRLIDKAIELGIVKESEVDILNQQWLNDFLQEYNSSSKLKEIDKTKIGHLGGIASLKKFISYVKFLKENPDCDKEVKSVRYWLFAPGEDAEKWEEFYKNGIMAIGWGAIGDVSLFDNKNDIRDAMQKEWGDDVTFKNRAHAVWQFAKEMQIGDVVFVKRGLHTLLGKGTIVSDYQYDSERTDGYNNVRKVNWTHYGEWEHPGQAARKTLTEITQHPEYVKKLNKIVDSKIDEEYEEKDYKYPTYTREDFLREVYMTESDYDTLTELIKKKKNVVLQGAPGVGKTYIAKRLAYSIMGCKDKNRVAMIQFHQSYSYEDFIMGFRPSENGFVLKTGIFYDFCKKAEIDSDNPYFFIIDEINRGNLSKIFGELFMLIESDKRGGHLQLLYSDEMFSIPPNVFVIGMMNTADRSLAMIDYALRRRFAFYDIKPGFNAKNFIEYKNNFQSKMLNGLIQCICDLNAQIASEEALGEGFCIGHSYFCNLHNADKGTLSNIVEYEIVPLIKEYWYDEPSKVRDWSNRLRGTLT